MKPFAAKLLNVSLYQLGWFCCVWGAAQGYFFLGALVALFLAALHLFLAGSRKSESLLMLGACLLGAVVDSAQQALGLITFKTDPAWPLWLPLWVFVIWIQFATLFRYALFWLARRYLLAAVFGLLGGPLAYWSGVRLGAATFGGTPVLSLACLAVIWALMMPALLWLSRHLGDDEGTYRWFRTK